MPSFFNAGCTIYHLRPLYIKNGRSQRYPISLCSEQECFVLYKNAREKLIMKWRGKSHKEGKDFLCCLSQEIPLGTPYVPNTLLDEEVYFGKAHSQLYRISKDNGLNKVFSWLYQEGDIVEVLEEDSLSLGIVVSQPPTSAIKYAKTREEWLSAWRRFGNEMSWVSRLGDDSYIVLAICEDGSIEERRVPASRLIQTYSLAATEQTNALRDALQ